jgi:hypothetical protein
MIDPSSFQHHAVLILDEHRKELSDDLWSLLSSLSHHHTHFNATVLDIDTARTIQSWNTSPHNSERKALISFHSITVPAQNALLKVLEEPSPDTSFILVTSSTHSLLPTLLSRVQVVKHEGTKNTEEDNVSLFFSTEKTLRMKLPFIQELLQAVDEKDRKDREVVRAYIVSLTQHTHPLLTAHHKEEILMSANYATDPSSSLKALLEYLSLLLPCTKK